MGAADMELEYGEHERVAQLYERLLERTKHIKVWISYAQFLQTTENITAARDIHSRAYSHFKLNPEQKEEVRTGCSRGWWAGGSAGLVVWVAADACATVVCASLSVSVCACV